MGKRGESKVDFSRSNLNLFNPDDLWVIGYDTKDGPEHILYDERVKQDPEPEFVDEIDRHGVLEPITVRRNGGNFEVVAGRRRVLAARIVNRRREKAKMEMLRVPAVIKRSDDQGYFEANIITNMHRKPVSTMQCARLANKYIDVLKRSVAQAASTFNVSRQSISTWLKLCELDAEVQQAVDNEEFSATAAIEMFYGKTFEQQKAKLERIRNKTDRKPSNGRPSGPSRPTIRKLLDEVSGLADPGVDDQFLLALRFVLGEVSAEEAGVDRFMPRKGKGKKKGKKSKETGA